MGTGNRQCKRRIALEVQYDGGGFNGWQIQNSGRTVQGEIERAVSILLKEKNRVFASGRTDSGVHALGQIVHFDTNCSLSLKRICIAINGIMPKDISIKNVFSVDENFHSRFSAIEREYRYLIYNHPSRTPFMINRAMWVHEELELDYFKEITGFLIGEMDFASFCKKRESKSINTVRCIRKIDIRKHDNLFEIDITGNAFLHNMIRIIIGTIVEMNKKNTEPELIKKIIAKRDRDYSGATAPAYGLYLTRVRYEPCLQEMESAF